MRGAAWLLAVALVSGAGVLATPTASACHDWRHCVVECVREILEETVAWVESLGQDPILAACGS